jgi:hypothetical protein
MLDGAFADRSWGDCADPKDTVTANATATMAKITVLVVMAFTPFCIIAAPCLLLILSHPALPKLLWEVHHEMPKRVMGMMAVRLRKRSEAIGMDGSDDGIGAGGMRGRFSGSTFKNATPAFR